MANRPIQSFKTLAAPGIEVSIWKGEKRNSFTIRKRYKDPESGDWKEAKTFGEQDLAGLSLLCQRAIAWSDLERDKARAAAVAPTPTQPMQQQLAAHTAALAAEEDDIPF